MDDESRFCSECMYLKNMHYETGEGYCDVVNDKGYGWENNCEYFSEYINKKTSVK